MYTAQQVQDYMKRVGAQYVTVKDNVQWWRLPDKFWIGVRAVGRGLYEMKRLPPEACGCGV